MCRANEEGRGCWSPQRWAVALSSQPEKLEALSIYAQGERLSPAHQGGLDEEDQGRGKKKLSGVVGGQWPSPPAIRLLHSATRNSDVCAPRDVGTNGHGTIAPNRKSGNNLSDIHSMEKGYKWMHIHTTEYWTKLNGWAAATHNNTEES